MIDSGTDCPTNLASRPAMPASRQSQRITTGDGVAITFKVVRAGSSAPKLVLIHSLAMDHSFWQPVLDHLAGTVSAVVIDARGHGSSDHPKGPYAATRMAADVNDVLDSLGWSSVVVGGASMGGCVAQQFALDYPGRTRALALMGTTSWYGTTATADWKARAEKALDEGLSALVDFQKTRWFSDAFRQSHPDIVQHAVDVFLRNEVQAYAATCNMLGSFDVRDRLGTIEVPTAILVGEEDYAAPPQMAQALHDGIAGSTMAVVPGARHLLPLEVPALVAAALGELAVRANA